MTSEQRYALVGMVMFGLPVGAALDRLGLTDLDLSMRLHYDDALRQRLMAATEFDAELQRLLFEEDAATE